MSKCPLIPTPEHLVVRRDEPETVTKGGIHLPDNAKDEKPAFARVLALGAWPCHPHGGEDQRYRDIKEGHRVALSKWGGSAVTVGEVEYAIVKYTDVLAIVAE